MAKEQDTKTIIFPKSSGSKTCEEDNLYGVIDPLNHDKMMPCGKPTVHSVYDKRANKTYRMCSMCADHSIKRRGMIEVDEGIVPEKKQTNELTIIEIKDPALVFVPSGLEPLLRKIDEEAREQAKTLDASTNAGRSAIISLARKVATSKTTVDKMGKELGSEYREKIKLINSERSRGVDRLQQLQDEIRKPVTDFENAEEERIAAHEEALETLKTLAYFEFEPTLEQVEERLDTFLSSESKSREWQEFRVRANILIESVRNTLIDKITALEKAAKEKAELERLQKEEADRKQKEHEDKIAEKAKDKADREAQEAADKLAEKVEADKKAAVQKEKDRQAAVAKRIADETARREADEAHRKRIYDEALLAMLETRKTLPNGAITPLEYSEIAIEILIAIRDGKITNISINY